MSACALVICKHVAVRLYIIHYCLNIKDIFTVIIKHMKRIILSKIMQYYLKLLMYMQLNNYIHILFACPYILKMADVRTMLRL